MKLLYFIRDGFGSNSCHVVFYSLRETTCSKDVPLSSNLGKILFNNQRVFFSVNPHPYGFILV